MMEQFRYRLFSIAWVQFSIACGYTVCPSGSLNSVQEVSASQLEVLIT